MSYLSGKLAMTILLIATWMTVASLVGQSDAFPKRHPTMVGWTGDGYSASFLDRSHSLAVGNDVVMASGLTNYKELAVVGGERITVIKSMADFAGLARVTTPEAALDLVRMQTAPGVDRMARWELRVALGVYKPLCDVISEDMAKLPLYAIESRNAILEYWWVSHLDLVLPERTKARAFPISNEDWQKRDLAVEVQLVVDRWYVTRIVGTVHKIDGVVTGQLWRVVESVDKQGRYRLEEHRSEGGYVIPALPGKKEISAEVRSVEGLSKGDLAFSSLWRAVVLETSETTKATAGPIQGSLFGAIRALADGADPNRRFAPGYTGEESDGSKVGDAQGSTLLHLVDLRNVELVWILLKAGADPAVKDSVGLSFIDRVQMSRRDLGEALRANELPADSAIRLGTWPTMPELDRLQRIIREYLDVAACNYGTQKDYLGEMSRCPPPTTTR